MSQAPSEGDPLSSSHGDGNPNSSALYSLPIFPAAGGWEQQQLASLPWLENVGLPGLRRRVLPPNAAAAASAPLSGMYSDDLPLWGFVGEADRNNDNKYFLFTHKNIFIRYNGNQIIHVNLTQESPKLIDAGKALDMTYSVRWEPTNVTFSRPSNKCRSNNSLSCLCTYTLLNSAISAAAEKLAECQETITNLSKQLQALQSPTYADASDKEKYDILPLSVANVLAEEDAKPEDFSSPTSEEVACKKEYSEPVATEKNLVQEQDAGTGHKADNNGSTQVVVRPVILKSPRASVSVDMKKKRRASLLSRLVFRKKVKSRSLAAMLGC